MDKLKQQQEKYQTLYTQMGLTFLNDEQRKGTKSKKEAMWDDQEWDDMSLEQASTPIPKNLAKLIATNISSHNSCIFTLCVSMTCMYKGGP